MPKTNTKHPQLIEAFYEHAAFDGWNEATLELSCKEMGIEPLVEFPEGIVSFTDMFADWMNEQMNAALKEQKLEKMKIRERIATGVITRIVLVKEHKMAIRRLLTYYAQPQYAAQASRHLFEACNQMWYAAGDTSTDYNYYTKRLLLSGVYSSTLLCWLQDNTENLSETRAFLDRRIENVMQIEKAKGKMLGWFEKFQKSA